MQKARRHTIKGAPTACRRMVSGALSLFCPKCFSPFPHGTGSLSVSGEYLALPDGPGGFTQGSTCPALLRIPLRPSVLACTGLSPSAARLSSRLHFTRSADNAVLQPRRCLDTAGLGSSPFARHYWGNHCYFLFLRVLRCFSSPRLPHNQSIVMTATKAAGLSHSEIAGSGDICSYPALFAAYHVLHRLPEPRHPPCALSCFLVSCILVRHNPCRGGRDAHTSVCSHTARTIRRRGKVRL